MRAPRAEQRPARRLVPTLLESLGHLVPYGTGANVELVARLQAAELAFELRQDR